MKDDEMKIFGLDNLEYEKEVKIERDLYMTILI